MQKDCSYGYTGTRNNLDYPLELNQRSTGRKISKGFGEAGESLQDGVFVSNAGIGFKFVRLEATNAEEKGWLEEKTRTQ